jgi:hypothetical protein
MRLFPGWRVTRLTGPVALALLACCLLAPPIARGECGHYVIVGAHQARGQPVTDSANQPSRALPNNPSRQHRPCSGPMCSGAPLTVPQAPVSTSAERGEQWITLLSFVRQPGDESETSRPDDGAQRPVRRPAPVYHPPRSIR